MKVIKCKTLKDYQSCATTSFFIDSDGTLFLKNLEGQWQSGKDENHWFSSSLLADTVERDVFIQDPELNTVQNPYAVLFSAAMTILVSDQAGDESKRFAREIVARKFQVIKLQSVIRAFDPTGKMVEDLEKQGVLGAYDMETPV